MTIALKRIARRTTVFIVFFLALVILSPGIVVAQEAPRFDVFGGFSYKRFDSRTIGYPDSSNLYGWNVEGTGQITMKIGVVLDFSGHYGSELSAYNFLIGPQYTWRRDKSRFFVHGLFGKADNRVNIVQPTRNGFASVGRALGGGGGFDWDLSPRITIRVVQADYLNGSTFHTTQGDIRVSTGLVFHFGHMGHRRKL
jgi:hypothetical protein